MIYLVEITLFDFWAWFVCFGDSVLLQIICENTKLIPTSLTNRRID